MAWENQKLQAKINLWLPGDIFNQTWNALFSQLWNFSHHSTSEASLWLLKSLINKFKLIILFKANKFDKDDEKEERNSTSSLSKVK